MRRRCGLRGMAGAIVVVVAASALAAGSAGARSSAGNVNLVTATVYDGVFADSQYASGWSDNEFQFAVSAAGRVTFDPIGPECAPTEAFPPSDTDVSDDAFDSYTAPATDLKVTLKGHFEPDGVAKGAGLLVTETIQDQSCVELDDWAAHALPKGTVLCPDVDRGLATYTTATHMTCSEANGAYEDGLAQMKKDQPNDTLASFESPGWECKGGGGDPIVSSECTRADEVFRLPAG